MEQQHELLAQILSCVLHINTMPGRRATLTAGGPHTELSVLVLDARLTEPLLARTSGLATPSDSELTIRRVQRTLQELTHHLQRIAVPQPEGAA